MTDLEPTPALLAAARLIASGDWKVPHDRDAYGPAMDPRLRALFDADLVDLHLTPADESPDHWKLTTTGEKWLAAHDQDAPVTDQPARREPEVLRHSAWPAKWCRFHEEADGPCSCVRVPVIVTQTVTVTNPEETP